MRNELMSAALSGALFAVGLGIAGSATSDAPGVSDLSQENVDVSMPYVDLDRLLDQFGETLVALGRIDALLADDEFTVLGQRLQSLIVGLSVGDYVAVLGSPAQQGNIDSIRVIQLDTQYVPGSSPVFLRASIDSDISRSGSSMLGGLAVDLTPSFSTGVPASWIAAKGDIAEVIGVQPLLEGAVLVSSLRVIPAAVGTGTLGVEGIDGSLGTGKTDGSLGTGKTDGSLGTGKTDGSLGTGKTDGYAIAD